MMIKTNKSTLLSCVLLFCLAVGVVVADFRGDLRRTVGLEQVTTVSAPGMKLGGSEVWVVQDETLTSPSTTIALDPGARFVRITSDANLTGIKVTGGTLNQVVTFTAAATGSNTIRFDDGTSMSLTGNITLTEGASPDYLHLICIDSDGDEFAGLGSSVN